MIERIRSLNIHNAKTVVSAFHHFANQSMTPQETVYNLEKCIHDKKDPLLYIAEAFREALHFRGNFRPYVSNTLKNELSTLHIGNEIPDLFDAWDGRLLNAENDLLVVNNVIPKVVQGVMSILFVNQTSPSDAINQIKAGDFVSAVKTLSSSGNMSAYDFYKWNNILRIADLAGSDLKDSGIVINSSEFDFDWFLRFFDVAGNIRAEDMRQLWARVLAGEIEHPGSFSLRTVEVLRNMSQAEALAFKNASSLVLEETDGSQFLFCDSDLSDYTINQRHGLGMEDILLLEEAGLISALRVSNEIEVGESADGFFNGGGLALIFESDGENASFQYKSYPLSQVARQLLPIVQEEADDGYLTDLGKVLRDDLSQIEVGVYRVLNREGNDIELDLDNNLLDS